MSEEKKDLKQTVQNAVPRKAFDTTPIQEALATVSPANIAKKYHAAVETGAGMVSSVGGVVDSAAAEMKPQKLVETYTSVLKKGTDVVDRAIAKMGDVMLKKAASLEEKHYVSTAIILEKVGSALKENYGSGEMKSQTDEVVTTVSAVTGFATGVVVTGLGVLAVSNPVTAVLAAAGGGLAGTFFGATGGKALAGATDAAIEGASALPDAIASRHVGSGRKAVEQALQSGAVTATDATPKTSSGPALS